MIYQITNYRKCPLCECMFISADDEACCPNCREYEKQMIKKMKEENNGRNEQN